MPTIRQLGIKGRGSKRRRPTAAALVGAPMRKGVILKMAITTPRKPNSAKRKYAKIRIIISRKVIHAHIPGRGPSYLQQYSIVMVEGGSPPDVPGVNYSLIRGLCDFDVDELAPRHQRRSKFGRKKPHYIKYVNEHKQQLEEERRKQREEEKRKQHDNKEVQG